MTRLRERLGEFLEPPLLFFAAPIALLVLVIEWRRQRRRLRERVERYESGWEQPDA